jgi:hypothetical protein
MHRSGCTLQISERFVLHTCRTDEAPHDIELIRDPLVKLSFFVAHALYHHTILYHSTNPSSQHLSLIQGNVPKDSSSGPSRTMANLSLTGATSQQEHQFSIGQGKGLNQVSQVFIPHLIN